MQAIVKVTNSAGEEVRQFTVEVEPGKGWKKRAEDAALKLIHDNERIQIIQQEQSRKNVVGEFKFTFYFEVYHKGVLKRITEISVLAENETTALERAVTALESELDLDETLRYTNRFRKQTV